MLDAASGTRELVLEVGGGSRLRPGQRVTVQLGAERRQVVTIPQSAVAREGYALVLEDNRTSLRAVTLGRDIGIDRVEVVSGIAPGEKVVSTVAMSASPSSAATSSRRADLPGRAELHRQGSQVP